MGYPSLVGRDVYVTQPMPSFTMGPISVSPQFTHPTHNVSNSNWFGPYSTLIFYMPCPSFNYILYAFFLQANNMHNSMDVMYNPHTSYVALPIQGLSGQVNENQHFTISSSSFSHAIKITSICSIFFLFVGIVFAWVWIRGGNFKLQYLCIGYSSCKWPVKWEWRQSYFN